MKILGMRWDDVGPLNKMSFRLGEVVTLTRSQVEKLGINPSTGRSALYPRVLFSVDVDYINERGDFVTQQPTKYPAERFTMRYKVFAQEANEETEETTTEEFPASGFDKTLTASKSNLRQIMTRFGLQPHHKNVYSSTTFNNLQVRIDKVDDDSDKVLLTFLRKK